ncbi:DUF2179 domain-containing protein [Fusibacter paucivorans]|uniref:DUF2179 domain-containing protein n=1 Tax=Fusibacter paucivorans TaxID=76009 RepID=A0ABS5PMT8_9FIRM|nr:DUF5698 domain-containing protein [Fusibacter paucivorans]MBS7525709.1 DUF2179 domain-containing protein [Fusibacter paucivorans]
MIYLFIVMFKIVEVSISTVRIVLITKGERKIGAFIAFFEVSLWVILVSTVLNNIAENPLKIIAYALGFAIGNFLGSVLEERIGIGMSEMTVIVREEHGLPLATQLREKGYAVTLIHGEGKSHPRFVLMMYVPRKKVKGCVELIKETQENAVITVSDKKPIYGGFGMIRK